MIPQNIRKQHIENAIDEIRNKGDPKGRESRKYKLIFDGQPFPPKYVVSLANKYANGEELDSSVFDGGAETNSYLESRGFRVVNVSFAQIPDRPTIIPEEPHEVRKSKHDERCPECKRIVEVMLRKLYRNVESNYKLKVGTHIEDYRDRPFYNDLEEIFTDLQNYRGYKSFVRTPTLPRCDFFVPNPGFLVEFDESQHFTIPRKQALSHYPDSLKLGFPKEKWIDLCSKIQAMDNDPCYRDEQRAWYDTLRDFLPEIEGLAPTVRLYSKDMQWCSLDQDRSDDMKRFQNLIESRQIGSEGDFIAVVIIQSNGTGTNEQRRNALMETIERIAEEMNGDGVILLPAAYFNTGDKPADSILDSVEKQITEKLNTIQQNIVVCLGIDGRAGTHIYKGNSTELSRDQVALAIDKNGITSMGRKFYPTDTERGFAVLQDDPFSGEKSYPRTFTLNGICYYLAVCMDIYGVRHKQLSKPETDSKFVILALAHEFGPRSSPAYFAKWGFAGASKQWNAPVFGTAVFMHRSIKNWPAGVLWDKGNKEVKRWKFEDNPIKEFNTTNHAIPEGKALIKFYSIQDLMMKQGNFISSSKKMQNQFSDSKTA